MTIKFKKILSVLCVIVILLSVIPLESLMVYAVDSEQSLYMRYETNYSATNAYRIWGIINGNSIQTTYSNSGFRIHLRDSSTVHNVGGLKNGVEKTINGVFGVTENLSIVNNGRYVKVEFSVRNLTGSAQIFSIGSGADIQIGNNDRADIIKFYDGSGFYMIDGQGAQFNFIGKNAYGVTNVDAFWFGHYSEVNSNMFNQVSANSITGIDSGMTFSWTNRSLAPYGTNKYSVLIGIGELNSPPTLELSGYFAPGVSLPDVLPGDTYTISGTVSDHENSSGTEVYYAIDNSAPVCGYRFTNAPGNFVTTIQIPQDIQPGGHTITIYAQDKDGGISTAVEKTFTVVPPLALTGHNLIFTSGQGAKSIDPDFIVSYSGMISGGKIYIDENFNSATDSLSFVNSGGITGSYNSSNGILTMSGVATAADYQNFIRNVKFNSTAVSGTRKIIVTLATGDDSVFYFSGTGHYYEYVPANGITWHNAKTAAEERTFQGLTGYLATITSAEENAFVVEKCAGDGWLGATDEGHDKEWYWVTGPEAGSKFCQQNPYPGGVGVAYTVSGWYQNFASGEPNDYPSGLPNGENYLHMYSDNGKWNDYSYNNSSIKGYLVEYGTDAQDVSGSVASIDVTFTDITPPTISEISGNPNDWTNGDVTLTVTASDTDSGLNVNGAYSFNNGEWTNSNSQSFSHNQTVNIRVRDNNGNIVSRDIIINKIDKEAPTFTGITQTPAASEWTDSVTLKVNGLSDSGAGTGTLAYSFSSIPGVYNWQVSNISSGYNVNQTVYVNVRDSLGNISDTTIINITNIDNTLPNTPVISGAENYTSSKWYNTDITVTASFTQTPGSAETIQYSLDGTSWFGGSSFQLSVTGIYSPKFRVIDELGRTSSVAGCTVQIDKSLPEVNADNKDYSWKNSNFYVNLSYSDEGGSGIFSREYALTYSTEAPSVWNGAGASESILIEEEGTWYIHYKVVDNAGNIKTGYYGPYKLDKSAPDGAMSIRSSKFKDGFNFVTSQSVTLDLTASDMYSNVSSVRFANSMTELDAAEWLPFSNTKDGFLLTAENGYKTAYCQFMDNAGNISQVYYNSVYLDTVKPSLSVFAPSQYIAKRGDVITYLVEFDDNSKNLGNDIIALNNGIDWISLNPSDIELSVFGSININDIIVTVEDVAGQPLKKLIKLSLPSDMAGEGSVNLKVAAGVAEDKAGNLSEETLCGFAVSIDSVVPVNQDSLFSGNLRVKGGSVVALSGSSVDFGGHVSDSVMFAPASYNGSPADSFTITATSGNSHYINAPLNEGEYYLYVVDSAGNISAPSVARLIVDNTGPVVTISEPDKTMAKNDSAIDFLVTFADDATLESIDTLFKKSKISLVADGTANALINIVEVEGNDRQRIIRLSNFTGNGTITKLSILSDACRDEAGNGSVEINRGTGIIVDCTNPEIPSVTFKKQNGDVLSKILNFITFKYFWKEAVQVTISSSDQGGSNIARIYYKTAEADSYSYAVSDADGNITFTLPVGFKGNVWAYAEDAAGNISSVVKSDGVISEDSAPVIYVSPADLSSWFNADVNLTVNIHDNEGIKEVRYSVDGIETVIDMVSGYTDKQTEVTFQISLTTDSTGHVIQINALDLAGNMAETYNGTVKIDKSLPIISSVTGNPTDWTDDDVTLTVNASDAVSGLAAQAYSFDGGATWQAENSKTYTQNTAGIEIKVKDTAGNIAVYETIDITKIDKTIPDTAIINNADKYTVDKWYNEGQTVTAGFNETDGCSEWLQYKVNDGEWTDGESVSVTEDGVYTVWFRVADYLGRTGAVQSVQVNIDKTAPTNAEIKLNENSFKSFLNVITFGLFFKDKVDVTISADSNISGLAKIEYQKVEDSSSYDPDGTWTSSDSFSVQPDDKFIVYARITDKAGNFVIINTDGAIVDSTNPVLTLEPDAQDWANRNISVDVTVTDNLSGVKEVTYTTDETVPQSGSVSLTDGKGKITLQNEGVYNLTVSVRDNSDNVTSQTIPVKIDKSLPIIISVDGNPTNWTKDNVTLTINAADEASGLAAQAYSFDGGTTWQAENTKTYDVNTEDIIIKVKDVAGNIGTYDKISITKIDKTLPNKASINNLDKYTENPWYNTDQTVTAGFTATQGCAERLQFKVNNGEWTDGASVKLSAQGNYTVSFRVIDELGRTGAGQPVYVNIDKTAPAISGAENNGSYYIGRVIFVEDSFGEIDSRLYNDGKQFTNEMLFEEPGTYNLTVKDKAGNQSTLEFTVKGLPEVASIIYTEQSLNLIEEIMAEFNGNNALPEQYRSDIDNAIKVLEERYTKLDYEVNLIKAETNNIKEIVDGFAGKTDGLIAIKNQIKSLYDSIAGPSSILTKEQKAALEQEADYLNGLLKKIGELSKQVDDLKDTVFKIPTGADGLISQKGAIQNALNSIAKLTKEQQKLLEEQTGHLNDMLNQISSLQVEVDKVIEMITKLPAPDKVSEDDADAVTEIYLLYNKLNQEQKKFVGDEPETKLYEVSEALSKLLLYDEPTDIIVTGVDGTIFTPDVYLKVTPITTEEEKANFAIAVETVNQYKDSDSSLKGKELAALYDVEMFKGDQKVQPDGKVRVKIKIPDNLKDRDGLDIIHIADDGTVTIMNATREGDYLVFITDHFSKYGIVAKGNCLFGICKALGQYDPAKGICYDWIYITVLIVVIIVIAGLIVYKRKRKTA